MKCLKIPLLYLLSFVLSVCPVGVYFFVNADKYISTVQEGIKLGAGAVLLLIIVLLKVMGKLRVPSRVTLFGLVFTLCYLLQGILSDLIVFSFLALVGEMADTVCQVVIRRTRAEQVSQKNAQRTADEVKKALSGRV